MIEKNIFQTWHTKTLPSIIQKKIQIFRDINPEYQYHLCLDSDMDAFVNEHFPGEISECYNRLNIIVAKADFWRYLVLYKYGGIYLDIDSCINCPLSSIITDTDSAVITAENNPGMFVQWMLCFQSGHPILKRTIDLIVRNIQTPRFPNDIHRMTGPTVYSEAINDCFVRMYGHHIPQRISPDTNHALETIEGAKYRLFGVDYNGAATFKMEESTELYKDKIHWREEQQTRPLLRG